MAPSLEQLERQLERGQLGISELLSFRRFNRAPFRLHPLGFLACTLIVEGTRKLRLHYWPLAGGAQQSSECQIHDHLFEFKSWVLAGSVQNVEYVASSEGRDFAIYGAQYAGNRSTLVKTGATLRLNELNRRTYSMGMSYSVPAGVLHETVLIGTEPAFTALVTNDVSGAAPLVFGPLNGRETYVYEREKLDDEVVEAMLAGA